MTAQPSLFEATEEHIWNYAGISPDSADWPITYVPAMFVGEPHWEPGWPVCDVDGSLSYWECAMHHGIGAPCSMVYRLTHPVHRADLTTCHQWPCNGKTCVERPRYLAWLKRDHVPLTAPEPEDDE